MGIETLAIAGFAGLNAINTMNQGQASAKAVVQGAQYTIANQANDTVRNAGKLQTSFLQSGISLDGGPMDAIAQAFTQGRTNISRTASNANATSQNLISSARTKALEGIATTAAGASAFGGSITSGLDQVGTAADFASDGSFNGIGQGLGSLGTNGEGPFQPPTWWG